MIAALPTLTITVIFKIRVSSFVRERGGLLWKPRPFVKVFVTHFMATTIYALCYYYCFSHTSPTFPSTLQSNYPFPLAFPSTISNPTSWPISSPPI